MLYLKVEKGTLNEKIADFFSQAKSTTIDFSALSFDDLQLRWINLGASGPHSTFGLGEKGIQKAPKKMSVHIQSQERRLSNSSTKYQTPVPRKSSNIIFDSQGKHLTQNPPMHGSFQNKSKSPHTISTQSIHEPPNPIANTQQGHQFRSQKSVSPKQAVTTPQNMNQYRASPISQNQSLQMNINLDYIKKLESNSVSQ
ncbi:MAG: hypothetical protein EZS28_008255 [Streblomastix strix]|uniref:Uncharacterized protein n=1 Tax=Streblomastix strix TaxID=222440 RepID=A0A5J4WN51_9EUKA|nr:MAG: hypothetical protein EZS28_008255 [Streblomastix strix]